MGKTMLRAMAAELDLYETFETWPCPCGYFSSPTKACSCSASRIQRHRAKWLRADLFIEVPPVPQRELRGTWQGTSLAELRDHLNNAAKHTSLALDEYGSSLLRSACTDLGLDARQRDMTVRVARAIANLDHAESIQPPHIAEAINYRMPC